MSGQWNPKTHSYEVYSTLEGGMVPTGKPMGYKLQAGRDYCGYCKASYDANGECNCNGFGHAKGTFGTCGYCGSDYGEWNGVKFECSCDGFGGDPVTHYKLCRYCSGACYGLFCEDCGQAQ